MCSDGHALAVWHGIIRDGFIRARLMTETEPRTIIAHGHIFKNAGTTFDWTLEKNFKQGFIDHRDNGQMRRGGSSCLANILEAHPGLKAIASHHLYRWMPLPESPHVTVIPCFFLRHPIDRVRSVYTFERHQKSDTPGAIHAKKLSFQDYVAWRLNHKGGGVVMNYQIRYCSGRKGFPIDDALIASTANFLSTVALTGVVDRYDESMVYFEEILREHFPQIDLSYVRQNVGKGGLSTLTMEDKAAAVLEELGTEAMALEESNGADLELYTLANRALDSQIGTISDFSEKLANFRLRCNQLDGKS